MRTVRLVWLGAALFVACSDRSAVPGDGGSTDAGRTGMDASQDDVDGASDSREGGVDGGGASEDARVDTAVDAATTDATTPIDAGGSTPIDETTRCEIGGAMQNDGGAWAFVPFAPGDLIPLVGGGQGALSAEIGLRVLDPPLPIDVRVVVRAVDSGRSRLLVRSMEDDFTCDGDGWCTLAPVYVPTWTLVDDPFDLMNLPVAVTATFGALDAPHCLATHTAELYRF